MRLTGDVRVFGGADDLIGMQRAVQRTWTADSHWHIGDLAWQRPSLPERTVALWPDPDGEVAAWAWLSPPWRLELHAPPNLVDAVLAWFDATAGEVGQSVTVMDSDTHLSAALRAAGYREVDEPFFRHCLRDLDDDLPAPRLPSGFRVRAIRADEMAERAAVHRAAWRPTWLGQLQVPPVDLGDGESGMTTTRYQTIAATWPYRSDLDQVVEAPDGILTASALGWYDEVNRVALLEPVGTDPRYARRGLGAAVSLACLHAMRDAGATRAVVCPRGDAAYPVARALYHRIGFRDAGRTVTYRRAPAVPR
ncbi:GNAT family N-acetyltransferase [Krasilnikovia sp. MM14-A1259]|uniref:GNAT family N-acetyltransferase n=1 Tax=Krasilnikovia sp. MM14-A1259 TaxID=3373539 RepID=UPI003806769E